MLPLLSQHIAEQVDSMTTYMLVQHEATLANLLEVRTHKVLYRRHELDVAAAMHG